MITRELSSVLWVVMFLASPTNSLRGHSGSSGTWWRSSWAIWQEVMISGRKWYAGLGKHPSVLMLNSYVPEDDDLSQMGDKKIVVDKRSRNGFWRRIENCELF